MENANKSEASANSVQNSSPSAMLATREKNSGGVSADDLQRNIQEKISALQGSVPAALTQGEQQPLAAHADPKAWYFSVAGCADQQQLFEKNGFVIGQLTAREDVSFGHTFLNLYSKDLPILITTDAILHAFQTSFDHILQFLETDVLLPTIAGMVRGLTKQLEQVKNDKLGYINDKVVLEDVSTYLQVANSILDNEEVVQTYGNEKPKPRPDTTKDITNPSWKQAAQYINQLADEASAAEKSSMWGGRGPEKSKAPPKKIEAPKYLSILGENREVDWTQFVPRGHYTESWQLIKYFQAMMWLARIMFVMNDETDPTYKNLSASLLLLELAQKSGQLKKWQEMEATLASIFGKSDNTNFDEMSDLIIIMGSKKDNVPSEVVTSADQLKQLRQLMQTHKIGNQEYRGDVAETKAEHVAPGAPPAAFSFFGQRFGLDSWLMTNLSYPNIKTTDPTAPLLRRHMSSSVDVAYAVMGNDLAGKVVAQRMKYETKDQEVSYKYRDGMDFAKKLTDIKHVIDNDLDKSFWTQSVYNAWLNALRALSEPSTDPLLYPAAMRTEAYGMKNLNTQLGSYVALKRDALLYIKPAISMRCGCDTPHGYVEPKIAFWQSLIVLLEQLKTVTDAPLFVQRREAALAQLKPASKEHRDWATERKREQWTHLVPWINRFQEIVRTLLRISVKEVNKEVLNHSESYWLRQAVESKIGASGMGSNTGWYYDLFFQCSVYSHKDLVTDIMTDYETESVLNIGMKGIDIMAMKVEHVGEAKSKELPGKGTMNKGPQSPVYTSQVEGIGGKGQLQYVQLPQHTPSNERVPGWEKHQMFLNDDGSAKARQDGQTNNVDINSCKPTIFYGPIFRYYETIKGDLKRMTDSEGSKEPNSRPVWARVYTGDETGPQVKKEPADNSSKSLSEAQLALAFQSPTEEKSPKLQKSSSRSNDGCSTM